ncbi:threonine/homoserine/homoserine lactone efflux protein [Kibdelosporangium banguiense]|uniref:Threonine/homoserine/homoserine lactone efflux protein n=1 Tax=Kibdelosporangium banguiense TaxID=1365924 RepID=A0ABS4TSB1_9PSEU|nr:LysE family translocator [Kibdelosporangium banguiense]MBP2327302.1 threonine/homoserine/homoserine lactone efflux protein [Kibdelosporangium banguiense]
MPVNYWAYFGFAILVVIAPGPDFAVVMKNSLAYGKHGHQPGLYTSFGVVSSLLVQGLAAALGVAALIVQSQTAFTVLKIVGAVYLAYLGIQSLRSALARRRDAGSEDDSPSDQPDPATPRILFKAFRQGFLSNISNPKVLAFYFSLLPQFVNTSRPALPQVLLLAGTHAGLALIWLVVVVYTLLKVRVWFQRSRGRKILEGAVGVALIGFGVSLATSATP